MNVMAEVVITMYEDGKMEIKGSGVNGPFETRILLQQADMAIANQISDNSLIEVIPTFKGLKRS